MIVRQAIWDSIRRLRRFDITQIVRDADVKRTSATAYVGRLEKGRYVRRVGTAPRRARAFGGAPMEKGRRNVVYALARDVGVEAPELDARGVAPFRGAARDQMWRTMKMIDEFTCRDLAVHASTAEVKVGLNGARTYIHFLSKAGYLARCGKQGTTAIYRLAKRTGRDAPIITHLPAVFDPNLGRIVWSAAAP